MASRDFSHREREKGRKDSRDFPPSLRCQDDRAQQVSIRTGRRAGTHTFSLSLSLSPPPHRPARSCRPFQPCRMPGPEPLQKVDR
ncbi:hypothetical protein LY76DRAFT_336354 [Colletotrichum caudatum]|nr:hypothetical protein LY76DRAFT_336354 [Colletotrichum caudatum]